ncbi:unnamed protein product [Adineta steineri]|uniref:Uncharacterized protein n=1 Tax=Adineta steineri TaxID=433720 RepID=A0A813XQW9_9BILA|nr:unnamed protein product [Adineta steineri]
MKKVSIVVLVLIGVLAINWNSVKADDEASFEEDRSKALDFLRRSIFHPTLTKCEEQKREAKEDYEERCEPSNPIYRNKGTQRNCPDLNAWDAFKNYEINDGLPTLDDLKPNIKLPKLPKLPTADEERCEPSFPLHRNTGTNRFCPDINDWKEFDLYEIGNGYSSHDSNSATSYVDRNQNTNNRNGDTRNRPPPIVPNRNDDYED